jgi:hypothetical protein
MAQLGSVAFRKMVVFFLTPLNSQKFSTTLWTGVHDSLFSIFSATLYIRGSVSFIRNLSMRRAVSST